MLAAVAAVAAVIIAMIIAYGQRLRHNRVMSVAVRIASMGYAVPGAVIAVGVLIPFAAFDNWLDDLMIERFGISTGLFLSAPSSP
jgi:iron(III) transport system permease protein